jgi:signal transduction histidine kinase
VKNINFFQTFRGKLIVILAFLLVVTLGVQYYLNLQAEAENAEIREKQEKALVAGITLGFNSINSDDRLKDLAKIESYFPEHSDKIAEILVIDDVWEISDSLNPKYLPSRNPDGTLQNYLKIIDIKDLPPLIDADSLGADRVKFPNVNSAEVKNDAGEAHAIPIQTTQGRFYVMVVLKSSKGEAIARAARSLVYSLAVLLISSLVTLLLVWRFTRPIANLSDAARRIADGDFSVRVSANKQSDEIGELSTRFNEMTAELAKKRELEARLQETEKSAVVGRLASAIAHEIRNPLNYINLTLDHLKAKFVPVDEAKREQFEYLTGNLKTEVARINHQITDFLRYSRPLKLEKKTIDAKKVVEDSLRIVEAQAAEQNIEISFVTEEDLPQISGDAEILRSVFNNLFINAVQAMEKREGGNLDAKIRATENFVKIEIADTGCGISPENLDKIFEPYFSTKETGTGLGLAIVKRIVDEHHGIIEVESTEGNGTKFTVSLPRAEN